MQDYRRPPRPLPGSTPTPLATTHRYVPPPLIAQHNPDVTHTRPRLPGTRRPDTRGPPVGAMGRGVFHSNSARCFGRGKPYILPSARGKSDRAGRTPQVIPIRTGPRAGTGERNLWVTPMGDRDDVHGVGPSGHLSLVQARPVTARVATVPVLPWLRKAACVLWGLVWG